MSHACDLVIREARLLDQTQLLEIEQTSFPDPWSEQALLAELDLESSRLLVGVLAHETVGYIVFRVLGPEAEILRIAVRPTRQRQGIGAGLVKEAVCRLSALDVRTCFLEVRADNHAALALYQSFSATRASTRTAYYRDGTDAVILSFDIQALSEGVAVG